MSPLLAFSSHLFLYSSLYYAFPICTKIGFFKLIYTLNILFLYRCYSRKEYYMPIPSCSHTITICTKIGQFILYILVLYSPYLQKCSFPPIFVQMLQQEISPLLHPYPFLLAYYLYKNRSVHPNTSWFCTVHSPKIVLFLPFSCLRKIPVPIIHFFFCTELGFVMPIYPEIPDLVKKVQ